MKSVAYRVGGFFGSLVYFVVQFFIALINPRTPLFKIVWGGAVVVVAYHFASKFW